MTLLKNKARVGGRPGFFREVKKKEDLGVPLRPCRISSCGIALPDVLCLKGLF